MRIKKTDNRLPTSISSGRKMVRIAISVDGNTPVVMEFPPTNMIPWMIQNFVFDSEMEIQIFGIRGGRIPDSEVVMNWFSIHWPER